MKKSLFYITTVALALVSCNEEDLVNVTVLQGNKVLTASFEQEASATRMNIASQSNALTWSEGDVISVIDADYKKNRYILNSGAGTAQGSFAMDAGQDVIVGVMAAFPYSQVETTVGDNVISFSLPSVLSQTEAGTCDLPMLGEIADDGTIAFKHLAGVLKVKLADIPEGYNTLTVTASNPICGSFTVTTNEGISVLASESTKKEDKTVTVNFGREDGNAVLYLPLPVGTYESIVVSVSGTDKDAKVLKNWTDKTVERAKVYATSVTDYTSVMTEEELVAVVAAGGNVTLGADIVLTQPLTLNNKEANVTIDLGTYSLTNATACDYDECGSTECYVFEVQAGTLNITGTTGSVKAIGGSDYDMAIFANGSGKVNISGGKFTNLGQENDGSDLIYVRDEATVAISGGEFAAGNKSSDVGGQYVALNLRDADRSTASIKVTGGRYYKFDPANNVSEGENTNFVSDGYSSVEEGDYYVVSQSN